MPIEREPCRHGLIETFDPQRQQMNPTYRTLSQFFDRAGSYSFWKSASQPSQETRSPVDPKKFCREIRKIQNETIHVPYLLAEA